MASLKTLENVRRRVAAGVKKGGGWLNVYLARE